MAHAPRQRRHWQMQQDAMYTQFGLSAGHGQTITLSTTMDKIPSLTPNISPAAVIAVGAIGLPGIVSSPVELLNLRAVWNTAISRVMILSLAMVCAALPITLGMEWLNAKKIASARKADRSLTHAGNDTELTATKDTREVERNLNNLESGSKDTHAKVTEGITTNS